MKKKPSLHLSTTEEANRQQRIRYFIRNRKGGGLSWSKRQYKIRLKPARTSPAPSAEGGEKE